VELVQLFRGGTGVANMRGTLLNRLEPARLALVGMRSAISPLIAYWRAKPLSVSTSSSACDVALSSA
jgi:hypothetical protein